MFFSCIDLLCATFVSWRNTTEIAENYFPVTKHVKLLSKKEMKQIFLILATLMLAAFSAYGQNPLADADRHFDAGKYEDAKRQYMLHKMNSNDRLDYTDRRIGLCDECVRLLNVADYLFSEKDYVKAKENYNKVLAINPKDPQAIARLKEIPAIVPDRVTINGLTWATRNVGRRGTFVANPEDYGEYYTFDEAQSACPSGWRVPTTAEFERLNNAGSEWTTINGVAGRRFGSGNNTVFFPAAGYRSSSSRQVHDVGSNGYYWSSTVNAGGPCSYGLYFYSSDVYPWSNYYRSDGYPVRCLQN